MTLLLSIAVIALVGSLVGGLCRPTFWLATVLVGALAGLVAAAVALSSAEIWELQSEARFGGELIHLRLDALSAVFLALLSFVGGAGAVYGSEYWTDAAHRRSAGWGRVWWSGLLLSLGLTLVVMNGLHFLIAWELFTVCAYFLVTLDCQRREVRSAGWLYLAASHAAAICLFAFFTLLASYSGSWELGPMRDRPEVAPLFWLALVGFGLKAGLFPLHIWLPSAHANAPSHVSAILSGVTIKIGIYGLVRFTGWLPTPPQAGWVIAILGVTSAVLGVAFALGQHDLKRLLAYHSVENIGIILIGLGFALVAGQWGNAAWGRLALAGGLLHVWNHGLFKSLLFLAAGSVLHATGTREMSQLGGLWKTMPWTAGLFALGAVAICGLPPLNGFVSELLVYLGLFGATNAHGNSAWGAIPAAILLAVTGALALACFVKVCGVVFLGAARSASASNACECEWRMRAPMILLAGACAMIGAAPTLFWPAIARAADTWNPAWAAPEMQLSLSAVGTIHVVLIALAILTGAILWKRVAKNGLARAVTWDCGYSAPSARMQYTAGSFAGIITEWFAWILRPIRHANLPTEILPATAALSEHTPETVLEKIFEPAAHLTLRAAQLVRRLQHGRAQSYLLYLLLGLAALAAITLAGGEK